MYRRAKRPREVWILGENVVHFIPSLPWQAVDNIPQTEVGYSALRAGTRFIAGFVRLGVCFSFLVRPSSIPQLMARKPPQHPSRITVLALAFVDVF